MSNQKQKNRKKKATSIIKYSEAFFRIDFVELIEVSNDFRRIGPGHAFMPPEIIDFKNGIFTLCIPRILLAGWSHEQAERHRLEREAKFKQQEETRQRQQHEQHKESQNLLENAHNVWK